jgi:hypothetical protein
LSRSSDDPGLREARKALLCLLFSHPSAARTLAGSNALSPEEMGDETLSRLLNIIYQCPAGKPFPAPADIVSRFETAEAQQQAAEVFANPVAYSTVSDIEKSLNQMIDLIKRRNIDAQIELSGSKNDLNTVNTLLLSKKNLQTRYITLSNG